MIQIREATAADDERIGELLVQSFVETYAKKMPEVVVNDSRKAELRAVSAKRAVALVLVAELGNQVVGTVSLFKAGATGSEAWKPGAADLRHLAVDPAQQGQGVSSALLDEAERIARVVWKTPGICLHVRQGATGVARLYMKRGFVRDPSGDLQKPSVYLEAYFKTL